MPKHYSMVVQKQDFIEIEYTGSLSDGTVFDTTSKEIADKNHLHDEKKKFGPIVICVGEKQILAGLDDQLVGKEIGLEQSANLLPEQAFGKRDVKNMRIVPISTFKEHNVQPQPGLQIDVDGKIGVVSRVSGGRIIVNFNHPLAGKEVVYKYKINKIITDAKEKLTSFVNSMFNIPIEKIKIEILDEKAIISIPMELPDQFKEMMGKKMAEISKLKEVILKKNE
jgi:FKBP-type peptidyl-prolyl cis-trans isomerase SlyD